MKFLIPVLITLTAQAATKTTAQSTPKQLGEMWVSAIKTAKADKIRPLIHPACPKESVSEEIVKRMAAGPLPSEYKFETVELGEKDVLRKIYAVAPDKQLNLKYMSRSSEERKKFGLGKGYPIARKGGKWYFVVCGKNLAKK